MISRTSFLQVRIRKCCPANSSSGRSNIVETWRGKYHQHGHCEKQNSLLQNFIVRNKSTAKVKPFSILGLQQIAVGDTDSKAMTNLWVDIFGLAKVGDFTSRSNIWQWSCIDTLLRLATPQRKQGLQDYSLVDWMAANAVRARCGRDVGVLRV